MTSTFQQLLPVILSMLAIAVITVWVYMSSEARALTKFILVPTSIVLSAAVPIMFTVWLGYSVNGLPDDFRFLGHRTKVVNNKKVAIEVWVNEGKATRLYITPYTRDLERILDKAAKGRVLGKDARISKKKGRRSDQQGSGEGNGKNKPHGNANEGQGQRRGQDGGGSTAESGDSDSANPYDLDLQEPKDIMPKRIPGQPEPEEDAKPGITA